MIAIEHNLKFITEVDETNETVKQLLALPKPTQVQFLESMLHEMVAPKLGPILDEINEGGSWAKLKVVK